MPINYCGKCGNAIQPADRFCQNCGSPVDPKPVPENQTPIADPRDAEERSADGPQNRSNYGAVIVLGIGLLLIAAALGVNALLRGAPALTAQPTATATGSTSALPAATGVPAVLLDKIVYYRGTSQAGTAFPKNADDTFLVILYTVPSNSWLYPQDFDWTILDETDRELKPIGFAAPLNFEDPRRPVLLMFMGRLLEGPLIVRSKGALATVAAVFIVPKEMGRITLLDPQKQECSLVIYSADLILDSGQIPSMEFDASFLEQPNGSEDWTFTP